jgi:hypothetical protein
MSRPLCTLCFSNFGLRHELEQLAGDTYVTQCPTCQNSGGRLVDTQTAESAMHRFFVLGSIPPETGGPAPLYEFKQFQYPGDIEFATELDNDLRLLSNFMHAGLFHYAPELWRLGYTEHYQMLRGGITETSAVQGEERKQVWREVLRRCAITMLEPGAAIFRVRRGDELPAAIPGQFDTPPHGFAGGGRYDTPDLPVFYGADDIETCLHESRVTLADWIALATFTPTRPLRLLDLTDGIDDWSAQTPFERVDFLMRKLAFGGQQDYDLCRELATEIYAQGLDGFYFTSYFSQANRKNPRNIALFGYPVVAGKLQLVSVNRLKLSSIAYEYTFGPPNDNHLPIDVKECDAIIEEVRNGPESAELAKRESDELLSRKAKGPR